MSTNLHTAEFTLTPNQIFEDPMTPTIKKERRKKKSCVRLSSNSQIGKAGTLKSLGTIEDIEEGISRNLKPQQQVYSLPTEPDQT